ncbi:6-hydroxymethylpterin diphosphokinase MptE-like protein [Polaribacter staleyi]|uniref:6-hydroxymethylpterin diphosphokinase MptE-like protein n=1 Tax=Polaribacter staleyi TaxID=2022337 RepID=UPI0031BAE584
MKSKIIKTLVTITYYPRLIFDKVLLLFVKNDYSILDKFIQEDSLIVGNGPSLNKTELEKISLPSIGMNKINMLFYRTTWRPDAIVCVNGLVIQQNKDFFNTTDIPLILPIKAWYLGVKKRPNIIFVRISNSYNFNDNLKKSIGKGSTVTYTCLQVFAALGVKSVNIVGVDHSFTLNNNKEHDIEVHKGDDVNHFDPNYFKDKLWGIPDLDGSEEQYLLAKKYFNKKGVTIKDFTIDGKLQIFPKGNIEDLYKKPKI